LQYGDASGPEITHFSFTGCTFEQVAQFLTQHGWLCSRWTGKTPT